MLQFSMFLLIYSVMSLDREYFMCSDLVASGLFLLYSYLYTVMMTIFGGGGGGGGGGVLGAEKAGHFVGKLLLLKYPR